MNDVINFSENDNFALFENNISLVTLIIKFIVITGEF